MLERFLKLCLSVALILFVPYYVAIIIFGSKGFSRDLVEVWCVGLLMIVSFAAILFLLKLAYDYVKNGK